MSTLSGGNRRLTLFGVAETEGDFNAETQRRRGRRRGRKILAEKQHFQWLQCRFRLTGNWLATRGENSADRENMTDLDLAESTRIKANLIAGMTEYIISRSAGYTEADIQKCESILDDFTGKLQKLRRDAGESGIFTCVRDVVLKLNELNKSTNGYPENYGVLRVLVHLVHDVHSVHSWVGKPFSSRVEPR